MSCFELQITTLIENMQDDAGKLAYEHGLSLYIEFMGKRLLFDTGQSGIFLENAKKLGKDICGIDHLIVSHGHYDHSGGLMQTVSILDKRTKLYVGNGFFVPKYKRLGDGTYRYNGNPFTEAELTEVLYAKNIVSVEVDEDITFINDNIVIFKNFQSVTPCEHHNPDFVIRKESVCQEGTYRMDGYRMDEFTEEVALGLITSKGLVLIVGCSHVGLINILEHVKVHCDIPIYCVLGGTHLVAADEQRILQTIKALERFDIKELAVSHCTGEAGMQLLSEHFGERFRSNHTGSVYMIEK